MSDLKPCPHCGAKESDLEDSTMSMAHMGSRTWEEPFEKLMIYCTNCGHYGDQATWDDRCEGVTSLQEARHATAILYEGVESLRRALKEPERSRNG